MSTSYAKIEGGGSLLLAWQIKNKKVLIVGGGNVAAQRIVSVKIGDADVTVVSPKDGLIPEVEDRIAQGEVHWLNRRFRDDDVEAMDMVLTAMDDHKESLRIGRLCRRLRIPVNVADVPDMCDFYFMSQHRDGPLQIAVSTNGRGPKLANMIRSEVIQSLPPQAGDMVYYMGILRSKVREWEPEISQSSKRMRWVTQLCEAWGLHGMGKWASAAAKDPALVDRLKPFYDSNDIPTLEMIL
ncbi:putative siroheme synthase Met8 [Hesseltinella vesiculosa]|uniref:precorrin-2 dehydrogenase n=1 Tax=Hesseltinella vesiculosa TaxID=101127 RepID=A0A1X2G5K8_9FUNG|nr:putative siroheme synthase Met8 [Hesseltinella vesiculosa]